MYEHEMNDNFDSAFCHLTDAENRIDDLKDYIQECFGYYEYPDSDIVQRMLSDIKDSLFEATRYIKEDFVSMEEFRG